MANRMTKAPMVMVGQATAMTPTTMARIPRAMSPALEFNICGPIVRSLLDEAFDEREPGVGDLTPATVDGQSVSTVGNLDELGHALGTTSQTRWCNGSRRRCQSTGPAR